MTDRTILHEGDDFVLHHQHGIADYIVVTFVGSNHEGSARHDYLLSEFATRYGIPCLGVTCKTRNLYTSLEMDQVIRSALPVLRRYATVVVVGNSIGGYAAIKFSRRLGATHVLAVTPAFSLDANELSFANETERSCLEQDIPQGIVSRDMLTGMAIRAGDVSGRIVVVHNPNSPVDVHQMKHLRAAIALEEMPLQHDGHNVFWCLGTPATMSKIVGALRFSGSAALRQEFRAIRRSNLDCITPMLRHAMRRHALLVDRALRSDAIAVTLARYGLDHGPLSNELAFQMARGGYQALAFARIERMIQHKLGRSARLSAQQELGRKPSLQPGSFHLLLSSHGSFLCTHGPGSELGLSWNPFSSQDQAPVFASASGDGLVLQTMLQDGRTSAPLDVGGRQFNLDWSGSDGFMALKREAGFLSAQSNDTILDSPHDADPSTRFLAIAVDAPASLVRMRQTGWLEASVERMTENVAGPARRTAARRGLLGSGWNRLFGAAAG